jgi:hypothetical protein
MGRGNSKTPQREQQNSYRTAMPPPASPGVPAIELCRASYLVSRDINRRAGTHSHPATEGTCLHRTPLTRRGTTGSFRAERNFHITVTVSQLSQVIEGQHGV